MTTTEKVAKSLWRWCYGWNKSFEAAKAIKFHPEVDDTLKQAAAIDALYAEVRERERAAFCKGYRAVCPISAEASATSEYPDKEA